MSKTFYKVWVHIEKINEDEDLYEDEGLPELTGESYKTLEEAEVARDHLLRAEDMQQAFNDAINFALEQEDDYDCKLFLRMWIEGQWPEIRKEFPEFKGKMD